LDFRDKVDKFGVSENGFGWSSSESGTIDTMKQLADFRLTLDMNSGRAIGMHDVLFIGRNLRLSVTSGYHIVPFVPSGSKSRGGFKAPSTTLSSTQQIVSNYTPSARTSPYL